MGDASATLKLLLLGEDRSASKSIKGVEGHLQQTGNALTQLGERIGGEFGEVVSKIGEGFSNVGEHGKSVGAVLGGVGATATGVGLLLQAAASKDVAAHQQLQAAITASGHSYGDYKDEIEKAIQSGERFGYTSDQTQGALQRLTQATNDPRIALERMTLAENLAASQHISLVAAAAKIASIYGGSSKVLKQYGITMDSSKAATKALEAAQKQQTAAADRLKTAQQNLSDLHAVYAAKTHLSTSQTIALRKAMEALHAAEAAVTSAATPKAREAALKRVAAAQQHLNDLQAVDASHMSLSTAETIRLQKATEAASKAADALKAANEKLAEAHARAKNAAKSQADALDKLTQKTAGQADAQSKTFTGQIDAIKAKLTDFVGSVGSSYGNVITQVGALASAVAIFDSTFGSMTKKVVVATAKWIAHTVALVANKVATVAVTAASRAWTVAQLLLNAALSANPIGIVVVAIAALVAGIIWAYKNVGWFRDIVNTAFHAIASVSTWLWNSILYPVIRFMLNGFAAVAGAIGHVLQALGNVPGFGWAKVAGNMMLGAANAARTLASNIVNIPDKTVTVTVDFAAKNSMSGPAASAAQQAAFAGRHFASGGTNIAPGWALVGENGPEYMYVPSGSTILPHGQKPGTGGHAGVSGSAGGDVFQIMVPPGTTRQQAMDLLAEFKRLKRGGVSLGLA